MLLLWKGMRIDGLLRLDLRVPLIRRLMQIDGLERLDLRMLLFKKTQQQQHPVNQYILLPHL
jgi:hypothetical protein